MINTVLFDMGGTLEEIVHSEKTRLNCGRKIFEYMKKHGVEPDMSPEEFVEVVERGYNEYKKNRKDREYMPYEVWSEWKLKGVALDQDKLRAISEKISYIWEVTYYERCLRHDVKALLAALQNGGYRMGIISNTASLTQVFHSLESYGIKDYFEVITLSSICGYRKPSRIPYDITLADMNALPSEAVYVGDTVSRDVAGSRNAGLAMSIRINSALTEISDQEYGPSDSDADFVIQNLMDVYDILEKYNNRR